MRREEKGRKHGALVESGGKRRGGDMRREEKRRKRCQTPVLIPNWCPVGQINYFLRVQYDNSNPWMGEKVNIQSADDPILRASSKLDT